MSQENVNTASENGNQLVSVDNGQVPALPYDPLSSIGKYWTNLPLADPDGMRLMATALNGRHKLISDCVGSQIDAYAIVAHPVVVTNRESGELIPLTRCVIVCHDGTMVETTGTVATECIGRICRSYGAGPWHPPIPVTVARVTTRSGNDVYTISPITQKSARMPWQQSAELGKGAKRGT